MATNNKRSSLNTSKDQTRIAIERMEAERVARRRAMKDRKLEKAEEEQRNIEAGNPGDVDFIGLVRKWREENSDLAEPQKCLEDDVKICICVRKRPLNDKERKKKDHDAVTCLHPTVWVHSAKLKVDGITKYIDNNSFVFDYAFDEESTTENVYSYSAMPLVEFFCNHKGGRATIFAYGQTGSGKTYTMSGIQSMVAEDLFLLLSHGSDFSDESGECATLDNVFVTVSFFELYGTRVQDLLNGRKRLKILEDGKGEIVITGLEEFEASSPEEFLALIDKGNRLRTTHATEANDTSSRSHAICQVLLREKSSSKLWAKLSLVDLAGSERGTDTKSHNRERRTESSEINKSLLALKECIRALDNGGNHVPYRGSKLTLVLKDCFTHHLARTTMIATVSPSSISSDHTINTLRYADRIKEKKFDVLSPRDLNVDQLERSSSRLRKLSPPNESNSPSVSPFKGSTSTDLERKHYNQLSPRTSTYGDTVEKVYEEKYQYESSSSTNSSIADDNSELNDFDNSMQRLIDLEENILVSHVGMMQENLELLTEEGKMLQNVQREDVGDDDIEKYAARLGRILDRKTYLISNLNDKIAEYRSYVKNVESQKV